MGSPSSGHRVAVDVVVPTLRRPADLRRCLDALRHQDEPPARIVVVVRDDDADSATVLAGPDGGGVEVVVVEKPGVVAALLAGVAATRAEVVAFTDDDAVVPVDWIERITRHFRDPMVGAVGGRDRLPGGDEPSAETVGAWVWAGTRAVGNHHVGAGEVRDVEFLKGVNMAYRAEVLALPRAEDQRSTGAQPGFELVMGAVVRSAGLRVVYDPDLIVDHHPARRIGVERGAPDPGAVADDAAHHVLARALRGRGRGLATATQIVAVGTSDTPGLARTLAGVARHEPAAGRRLGASLAGVARGVGMLRAPDRHVVAAAELRRPSRRRPRVAVVAHAVDDSGGQERVAAELIRRSCDVVDYDVVAASLAADLSGSVRFHRVRLPPGPFPLRYVWFAAAAAPVVRRLRRRGVLVHTTGAVVGPRVDVASIHYLWSEAEALGARPPGGSLPRRLSRNVTRVLASSAERRLLGSGGVRVAVAVSDRTATTIRRDHPIRDVVTVPNGVDIDRFAPDPAARAEMRAELGTRPAASVALFVGGDWLRKGLDVAIEAVAPLDGVELWVAGDGDTGWALAAAERAGVANRLRLLGFRRDVERLYAAADVLVAPSRYETFGLMAAEAAAAGVPIVTRPAGAPQQIIDALPDWLVVDGPAESFTGALRRLLADPAAAREIGATVRAAAADLDWDRSVAAMLDVYAGLGLTVRS